MVKSRKIAAVASALVLLLVLCCGIYVSDYYRADDTALAALHSSETVTVTQAGEYVAFIPEDPAAGFIFYPGGKVEFTAYAPLLHALAEEDILCIVTKMPCNLAVLNVSAAEGIGEQYPQVEKWYIGGHSLGGSMAASYAAKHFEELEGLVLLASYSTADLQKTSLDVISLCGSEDHVLNMEKYEKYGENLPPDTAETAIPGGCHAYFGSYGAQEGDGIPTVTPEEQIQVTVQLLSEFFS